MKKLTTFINELLENGNAKLIEATDEENVYSVTICKFYKHHNSEIFGCIVNSTCKEKYNKPLIINGQLNPFAKKISSIEEEGKTNEDFEKCFGKLLCRLVKANLSPDKSIIVNEKTTAAEIKTYANHLEKKILLNLASSILGMSNHAIVCCVGTSLDYIEKYLEEEALEKFKVNSEEQIDISSIEVAEDNLMSRIEYICSLATRLKSDNLSREEYNKIYPEWIKLYEDREFNRCSSNGNAEEKKHSLQQINQ